MEPNLEGYRKEIEEIDEEILLLIARRNKISEKVAMVKKIENLPITNVILEKAILNKLKKKNFINEVHIEIIWDAIFVVSKDIQKEVFKPGYFFLSD